MVLFLELLLVKDLDREDTVLIDSPTPPNALISATSISGPINFSRHIQVKWFVPIWVQRLLDNRSRVRLLAPDGSYSERIGET